MSNFSHSAKKAVRLLAIGFLRTCCADWGGLTEIVTDNGPPFVKAVNYLAKKYHIYHIRISGYNSCANSIVERLHFDV